jgi:putative copper resistance protein D
MAQLLDLFAYLSVILRGFTLAFQSLVIGGVTFMLCAASPLRFSFKDEWNVMTRPCRRLIVGSALGLAATQLLVLSLNSMVLMGTTDMRLGEIAGADFFLAGSGILTAALIIALLCGRASRVARAALPLLSIFILAASVATSHAAARLEHRFTLALITALHQLATAAWLGGLPYLILSLGRCRSVEFAKSLSRRFSRLAFTSVMLLGLAGLTMATYYVDSTEAAYGTAYGVMVIAKVALFAMLLPLGALNFFIVKRASADAVPLFTHLRRFAAAEVGIGFTVILAAASLTSQPPATDMTTARVSLREIAERMAPRWPRLESPAAGELSTPTWQIQRQAVLAGLAPQSYVPGTAPAHPNTPADMAWSEYNHHWAGVVVLLTGVLALAARSGRARWARHWPLLFAVLAVFLFFRSDPESWPVGPNGFWESFTDSEIVQHRLFVALIIPFALFEWRVQTGRVVSRRAAQVFPLVCALGGALLLTHSHALGNVKEELLAEWSHMPLAVMGVLAGWSRWLELKVAGKAARALSLIWPVCFVVVGSVLLLYRES